jgi:hypothetical protein
MILLLLIVTATFRPATPTVGDLITIEFAKPVVLDQSPSYEIVSQRGTRVVVRAFEPKPLTLSGVAGGVRFRNLVVPMKSVLKPKDKLDPAPLRPPIRTPYPRLPFIAIGIAALIAIASWAFVILRAWSRVADRETQRAVVDPAEAFRSSIAKLRSNSSQPRRWAALADVTRWYLATLSPHLGVELTSSQLLPRVDAQHVAVIAQILRQGDLEKFSPWGAPPADFDSLAIRALDLIPVVQEEEEAAA